MLNNKLKVIGDEMKKKEFSSEILEKSKNKFDEKYISKKHTLKNKTITAVDGTYLNGGGSSFCKQSISSGVYQYKFRIGNINGYMIIGIWKIKKNWLGYETQPPTDQRFSIGKYQGYGFNVFEGKLTVPETGYNGNEYGIECYKGTTITMCINMDSLELSYSINDTDYGIAYKIKNSEYRVAVFISNKGDSIELL
eukprot:267245_1